MGLFIAAFGGLFDQQHPRALPGVGGQGRLPIPGGEAPGDPAGLGTAGAQVHQVQPCFGPGAARAGGLGTRYSAGVVDPVSLGPADELNKSFSVISADRKYFSGASGIKISDNEHPAPGLGDVEIGAVTHSPFQTIPQLMKRGEDGVKCPALVMRKQSGNIFKT